jgi:4-amino-4-deoxy-L-arabinose transferase-like glycosyltransferase
MYLGPLYYYMMAIPLLLANFSPIGPAIQIAILGIITVTFVWWAGREWFGSGAGLIAAGLYAISPTIIIYSRSSWNPNIMPLLRAFYNLTI